MDIQFSDHNIPKALSLYLKIQQYPIMRHEIHERMRQIIFSRGVITPDRFEEEVEEKAIASQLLEGLTNPVAEESPEVWQERVTHVRDQVTEFYFAYNIPMGVFDDLVRDILSKRTGDTNILMTYKPELTPLALLFHQGEKYERADPETREQLAHHLEDIRVVIIKSIISDQLAFVGVAKKWLSIADLRQIRGQRIGRGKIGGKAAGVVLASKILETIPGIREHLRLPRSYFIGTDVFTELKYRNQLTYVANQKYKSLDEISEDYPQIQADFARSKLPKRVLKQLRRLLADLGNVPLIVRSSSLLEDSFGTSFAGKYDSYFCANQGTLDENLAALTQAMTRVYASVYNPEAMLYRRQQSLLDYDERMAILLQVVEGQQHGDYYYPTLAGVGFSHNPFKWHERIDSDAGFVRLVWGLGTRAVDNSTDDYPRMLALSHPDLRPEVRAIDIRRYSQHSIDLINLSANRFETHPIENVFDVSMPDLRFLVSQDKGGYMQDLLLPKPDMPVNDLVLTFEQLLKQSNFVGLMHEALQTLAEEYGSPVDIEFTASLEFENGRPQIKLCLIQCRPQSYRAEANVAIPQNIADTDKLFWVKHKLIPTGEVHGIRYVVYVEPAAYTEADTATKVEIARVIGQINHALNGEKFVLVGPNRWGSSNPDLGVKVTYADIHNTRMLIEVAYGAQDSLAAPQPSHGTHFYQDLVESNIYPLALYPNSPNTIWQSGILTGAPNQLAILLPDLAQFGRYVYVNDIPGLAQGRRLSVVMDGSIGEALGYLR